MHPLESLAVHLEEIGPKIAYWHCYAASQRSINEQFDPAFPVSGYHDLIEGAGPELAIVVASYSNKQFPWAWPFIGKRSSFRAQPNASARQ